MTGSNVHSRLKKRWILRSPIVGRVEELARSINVLPAIARLLINRKIETVDEAQVFIESALFSLHDPFLITGMESAANRILKAIALH